MIFSALTNIKVYNSVYTLTNIKVYNSVSIITVGDRVSIIVSLVVATIATVGVTTVSVCTIGVTAVGVTTVGAAIVVTGIVVTTLVVSSHILIGCIGIEKTSIVIVISFNDVIFFLETVIGSIVKIDSIVMISNMTSMATIVVVEFSLWS